MISTFNPLCSDPAIIVRNNGSDSITSLEISYGIEGHIQKSFSWNGNLAFLEEEEISLPVDDYGFWGSDSISVFRVSIDNPNNSLDENTNNNILHSTFNMTDIYEGYERWLLRVRTNSRAAENEYSIVDQDGNIILERKNLSNSTTYDDEISLPEGCYSFLINDSGNDGLSFWNNPSAGSGLISIRRIENEIISFEKIRFQPDFGGEFRFDFIIDGSTATEKIEQFSRFSLYPNPSGESFTIEAENTGGKHFDIRIHSIDGVLVRKEQFDYFGDYLEKRMSIADLSPGQYIIKLKNENSNWVKSFIKL